MNSIKIVIADDNKFFADALKDSIETHKKLTVVQTVYSIDELVNYTQNSAFDILILDINFNGVSSLEHISSIRKNHTDFKIIVLTTLNNEYIKQEALHKNVDGFVGKDSDLSIFKHKIIACFENDDQKEIDQKKNNKITIGNLTFTRRKLEILQAIYTHSDKTEKALSNILNISESALKSHKRELFEITNTANTTDLIKFGIQNGLIIA